MRIAPFESTPAADRALERLLDDVYVGGGFTEPSVAESMFRAANVKARGQVFGAFDERGTLAGAVVAVRGGTPASRLAVPGESELHLLCVRPGDRTRGVGYALVQAAIDAARGFGATRMILWTQSTMESAQRLYVRHGFTRDPARDFTRGARQFQVFTREL
jgi:GNAT superfamily N-acetyltransferase